MKASELKFEGQAIRSVEPESTETFTWADAKPMINRYLDHLFRIPTPSGKRLNALMVDADNLRSILADESIDEVALIFAVRETSNGQDVTTVIAGVKFQGQDGSLTREIQSAPVFDYCQPCPEICPTNLYTLLERTGGPSDHG